MGVGPSALQAKSFDSRAMVKGHPTTQQFAHSKRVPLNSSALLLDRRLLKNGPELVRRIASLGDRRLMIVVTMQCRLSSTLKPFELGLMTDRRRSWKDLRNFEPLDEKLLQEYRSLLEATFSEAAKHDLAISIMLHLDPAGAIDEWRNHYDFDPSEAIHEWQGIEHSYESAVVDSVIASIKNTVPADAPIQISLAGEMGRSVFAYPVSYQRLVQRVHEELADYSLEVGLSLNHSDLAGGFYLNDSQREEATQLFDSLDFVGYSHYKPFALPSRAVQFAEAKNHFVQSLSDLGISLSPNLPLHLSEVAIGGAPNERGVAFTDWASAKPWEGTNNPRHNPWRVESMIDFRRDYHDALLEFLTKPSSDNPVEAAYLWSEGSWDPLGVSSSYFIDSEIKKRVGEHNANQLNEVALQTQLK